MGVYKKHYLLCCFLRSSNSAIASIEAEYRFFRMELRTVLCALVVLATIAVNDAAPASGRCAKECSTVVNPKFNYAQGRFYSYKYEAETGLNIDGGIKEKPGYKISAVAEFHAVSPCEIVLKLTNVQLSGSLPIPNAGDFKKQLEAKTLLFSHSDGRVDDLCADAQDPAWVLNIKRAVVSLFQNSMDNGLESHVREVDVVGQCNTHYTLKGNEITKIKDILSCNNRLGNISAIQADHYYSHSDIQSVPLLESDYECGITIDKSLTKAVKCHETHRYRVHAKGEKAAYSSTNSKLTYDKNGKSSIKIPQNWVRTSLLFDHNDAAAAAADVQDTNNVIKQLCKNYENVEIGEDASNQFTRLVYNFKRLSVAQIKTIYSSLPATCGTSLSKIKDTFASALIGAATENSLVASQDLQLYKDASAHRLHLWSLSLAFMKHPTSKIVDIVASNHQQFPFDVTFELAGSSIVHSFCRDHTDCQNDPAVQKIFNIHGSRLQGKCVGTEEEEDKIISSLKAFGNIGRVGQYAPQIVECIRNKNAKVPIRIAAAQAFRRVPADISVGYKVLEVLEDETEDTEVRIAVYLALARHPIPILYDRLKNILEHEVVNQVSSFIWTHLHNLQHTENPLKREARELAEDLHLQKKFHNDFRKYSRNYDASYYNEKYNVGSDLEGNLIFSPESYVPRSFSLNYTTTLFGLAVNIFELNVRTENFEYLLEKYFGPVGKVTTGEPRDLLNKYKDRWNRIAEGIENQATGTEGHRHKRELPYKSQKLNEVLNKAAIKPNREPSGSLSLKVFGNELKYFHFHKLEELYDRNNPYHLQEIFNKLAKHKEADLTRNWLFLDGIYSVPTLAGVPLRLDVNGTASIGLKLKSHFDVRQFLLRPRSADIQSFIQPSANFELSATLLLDAYVSKTGLKFRNRIYTAGAVDGTFQLKQGESLVAKLDLPTPSQKILQLRSNSFVVQNDVETPVTPVNPNRYEIHGCSAGYTGLELCADLSLPKPLFDENRPFATLGQTMKYDLILQKKDKGLQGYHFTALWKRETGPGDEVKNTEFKLSFEAPGASESRGFTVDYQLNRVADTLRLNVRSPRVNVGLNGNYVLEPNKKAANFKLQINDRQYTLNGQTTVDDKGATKIYDSNWEVIAPGRPATKLTGKVIRTVGKKLDIDLKTEGATDRPISVKGYVQRDGPLDPTQSFTAAADLQIVLPFIETKIVGSLDNKDEELGNHHKLDLNVDYTLKSEGEKRNFVVKLDHDIRFDREAHEFRIKRDTEFRSSRYPDYNIKSKILLQKENQQYHSLLDLKWGGNFDDVNKKVFYEHTHTYKLGGRGAYEGQGQITFIYPKRNIDWKVNSKIDYQPKKELDWDLEFKYADDKSVKLEIELKNDSAKFDKYFAEIKLTLPTREIILRDQYEEKVKGEYTGLTFVQWQKGAYITINSGYKDKSAGDTHHHELDVIVTYGTETKPLRKYKLVIHHEPTKFSLAGRLDKPDDAYTVDATYDRPSEGTANLNLNVKLPWVEGKVASKRVPGDFQGNVDLKTFTGRKVKGSATIKGDTVKLLAADLKWDEGRDDSKKFSIKAEIERPRRRAANIKGTVTLPIFTAKGTFNYALPPILFNGDHKVFLDVDIGSGKRYAIDADINIDRSQSGRRKSHGKVIYTSPSVKDWTLNYDTDLHIHPDEKTFNADVHVQCPKHGHYGFKVDYLRGYKKISSTVEVQLGEGKTVGLGLGAFFDLGGQGHGYDIGGSFSLKTPFPGVQDIAITLRDAFHHSPEAGHFVTDHHVRWAPGKEVGLTVEYNRVHKRGDSLELTGKFEVNTPFEKYRHQKFAVDFNFDRTPVVALHANVDAEWGENKKIDSHLHYTRDGPKIASSLVIEGTLIGVDATFTNELTGPNSHDFHLSIKDDSNEKLTIDGTVISTQPKVVVDITINPPVGRLPVITVKGQLVRDGTKRNADVTGTWGQGKSINFKVDLTLGDAGSFKGNVKANSQSLGIKDATIGVERKIEGPKRSYGVHFNFGEDRDIELNLQVNDKPDKTGVTGTGAVIINGDEFISSKVDVVDAPTKKNYFGRILEYSAEINNPGIAFSTNVVLLSEKGINPTFKLCSLEGENCVKFEALLDLDKWDPKLGPIDNTAYAKFTVQNGPGNSRTSGFLISNSRVRSTKEATVKLILNEEQNRNIGFYYKKETKEDPKKPDSSKTYQLILPSRTFEARSQRVYSNQGYVYTLNLLADSVKEPNKGLLITSDVKRTSDGLSFTRNTKITVKHAKLSKDLIILSNIKARTGKVIFSQKIDFDLSKDPKKKFSVELEVLDEPRYNNGHNYTFAFGIQQPGVKNLDFKIKAHIGRSKEARTAGFEFNWLTRANKQYVISFLNDINKVQRTVGGYLHTPLRHISWDGTYLKFDDGGIPNVRGHLDLLYNNKVVRSASFEYSRGPEYNVKYFIDPADKTRLFRVHGGVIDDSTYQWTATRIKGSQVIEDFSSYHHLNNSHLLFNRYTWRPDLISDVRDAVDARLDTATDILVDIARNFLSKAGEEVDEKTIGLRDIVKNDIGPVIATFKEKITAAVNEIKAGWTQLKLDKLRVVLRTIFGQFFETDEIVDRLEKRIERIYDVITNAFTKIKEHLSNLDDYCEKICAALKAYIAGLPDKIQAWRTNIRAKLPEIADRIRNFLIRIRDYIDGFVADQHVSKLLAKFREIWDKTFGRLRDYINVILEAVLGDDDGKGGLYERVKARLYELAEGDSPAAKILKEVLLTIKSIRETVGEVIADIKKAIQDYREEALKRFTALYNSDDPDLKELVAEFKAYREKLIAKYHDNRSLKEKIRAIVDKSLGLAKEQIHQITSTAVFDPKNGKIQFYLPLILPVDTIRTLRTEGFTLQRLIQREKHDAREVYKRIKRALKSGDVLPPFEGHALLIGDQHFVTFDHRFYDFLGKCQYVLTTDLVDRNFSVIVNYGDEQGQAVRKSVVVISDTHNIEIRSDYKVLLDEQEVELPNQIENTHIHRDHHSITVDNNKGFTLLYDYANNLVLVNVSGFYFNRLGGLFGNYNNEPSDDFHTSDGRNVTYVPQFVNSWDVSNRCPSTDNVASHTETMFGSEGYLWCHKLFSSSWSPFKSCFKYGHAEHYLKACLEEVFIRKGEVEPADVACRIGAAFVDTCHHHHIEVELPSKCLRCSRPDGSKFGHGDIQTIQGAEVPKSADVVFVVEQKVCNRQILLDSLDEVSIELDKELTSSGLTNNHYGIVAFGGEGIESHAHPHTARGKLLTDARSVKLALKNLVFAGTSPSDAFEAIAEASDYPFRIGVAKTIILFLCSRCSDRSQSIDYYDLQHKLLDQGITLHILSTDDVTVRTKPQVASQIIGYDAKTTYKTKDASQKTLSGDADVRPLISQVDDVCFQLAQELDGSIFRSNQLSVKKSNVGKNVKTVFSRRVVASAKPPTCQNCDCVAGNDGIPIPHCSPCTEVKPRTVTQGDTTPTGKKPKKP
ncbi:hypothetical protein CHUAL_012965 [Chamberlinius hualienensis]